MATAREEIEKANKGQGCLGKAAPDEPVFILRGQDRFASELVEYWARQAGERLGFGHPKIIEAQEIAERMRNWKPRRYPT